MRLANPHYSNIGGFLFPLEAEAVQSHRHSRWFIVPHSLRSLGTTAKAPIEKEIAVCGNPFSCVWAFSVFDYRFRFFHHIGHHHHAELHSL